MKDKSGNNARIAEFYEYSISAFYKNKDKIMKCVKAYGCGTIVGYLRWNIQLLLGSRGVCICLFYAYVEVCKQSRCGVTG